MKRLLPAAVIGAAVAAAAFAVPAAAAPPLPPPPPCSFALAGPVRAADTVTATVASTGCAAAAAPYSEVACLRAGDTPAQCTQGRGDEPAVVVLPYQPGTVYTADGRGCAGWVGLPPAPGCQLLGPATATP